jgi:hypothetical protein
MASPPIINICGIRVVLFCKGRGADPNDYRPNSDESQWCGRRDALVRCATAFLFGPQLTDSSSSREMVLLFDDDAAVLRIARYSAGEEEEMDMRKRMLTEEFIPTERTFIQLWKRAAQKLGTTIHMNGMKCSIRVDATLVSIAPPAGSAQNDNSSVRVSPQGMDNKRQILEYLQQRCSIEFLREHRLNSHSESVLRKTSRDTLLKVSDQWNQSRSKELHGLKTGHGRQLELFLYDMLQIPLQHRSEHTKLVAGKLHETCQEFPCFDLDVLSPSRNPPNPSLLSSTHSYYVTLFLGAVRDMSDDENAVLQLVCDKLAIPCVGIRFGTVPEFTSKILSLLAFHHSNKVLGPAIHRLVSPSQMMKGTLSGKNLARIKQGQQLRTHSTCLNVICTIPMSSKDVSADLERRNRVSWCLVRVVVCTLWRSKLASTNLSLDESDSSRHTNTLHLIFDDGVVICLPETDFVKKLALNHKAAPSENQVLTALVQDIGVQTRNSPLHCTLKKGSEWSRKKLAKSLVRKVVEESHTSVTLAIGLSCDSSMDLVARFYNGSSQSPQCEDHHLGLILILNISASARQHEEGTTKHEQRRICHRLLSACTHLNIPTTQQRMIQTCCPDKEAATVIAMQQFCYQQRVILETSIQQHFNKKRKRCMS